MFGFSGCSDNDLVNADIEQSKPEVVVDSSADIFTQLKSASEYGATVRSVTPLNTTPGGWQITFTDYPTITVYDDIKPNNNIDDVVPYVSHDIDGYWCVSFDNKTTSRITDNSGDFVRIPDADGKNGVNILAAVASSRIIGYATRRFIDAETVHLDTILTSYVAQLYHTVRGITENPLTRSISILLSDGNQYCFAKECLSSASISLMSERDIELGEGTTTSFEFRISPSDAVFNNNIDSLDCEVFLNKIGAFPDPRTLISNPVNYKITKVEQVYDDQGIKIEGLYRASVKDLGISSSYNDVVNLVISPKNSAGGNAIWSNCFHVSFAANAIKSFKFELAKNEGKIFQDLEASVNGDEVTLFSPYIYNLKGLVPTIETNAASVSANGISQQIGVSSVDFSDAVKYTLSSGDGSSKEYNVTVSNTGLPLVVINTQDSSPIVSKTEWMPNTSITIYNPDGSVDYKGSSDNVRGRGNSTWEYAKKPYALKLDKKAELLGMPKHKRWVLLANWRDRTLLRNDVAFELSKRTCLDWTPRGYHVEVILNGKHLGNYYLCEQIKVDKNRVNVNELEHDDVDESIINGGYLMELDTYYDEVNKFKSSVLGLPYMFKEPDEEVLNDAQFTFMENYVAQLEKSLYDANLFAQRAYTNYIDVDSYIDFFFVNEIVGNRELYWPKSCYMHKNKDEKMKAGPVWDFDYGTFMIEFSYLFLNRSVLYYARLENDPQYVKRLKERWDILYPKFLAITSYIDEMAAMLDKSQEINIGMWPLSERINRDEAMSYEEAIGAMKNAVVTKINWMNNEIRKM